MKLSISFICCLAASNLAASNIAHNAMHNAEFKQFNPQGQLLMDLNCRSFMLDASQQTANLRDVQINYYSNAKVAYTIRADTVLASQFVINQMPAALSLSGEVILRKWHDDASIGELKAETMQVDVPSNTISSQDDMILLYRQSTTKGRGFSLNLMQQELNILSNVVTYQ